LATSQEARLPPAFAAAAFAFAVVMVGTTLPTPLYTLYKERYGFTEP
jgi:hypothetical protein